MFHVECNAEPNFFDWELHKRVKNYFSFFKYLPAVRASYLNLMIYVNCTREEAQIDWFP